MNVRGYFLHVLCSGLFFACSVFLSFRFFRILRNVSGLYIFFCRLIRVQLTRNHRVARCLIHPRTQFTLAAAAPYIQVSVNSPHLSSCSPCICCIKESFYFCIFPVFLGNSSVLVMHLLHRSTTGTLVACWFVVN